MWMMGLLHPLAPPLYKRVVRSYVDIDQFKDQPAPVSAGNLYAPMAQGARVSGGWRQGQRDGRARLALGGVGLLALSGFLALRPRLLSQRKGSVR